MTTPEDVTTDESIETDADRALDEIEAALAAIEQSIAGLDDGSYGRCEICGESVGAERLEVRATERRCVTHAHA